MASKDKTIHLGAGATFKLETIIGESTFGEVWSAHWLQTDTRVALKLVHQQQMARYSPGVQERWPEELSKEISFLERIRAGHVIRLYRHGFFEEMPVMVLEQLHSCLYRRITSNQEMFALKTHVEWFRHLVEGVRVVHREGVRHLDLKPQNILLTPPSAAGQRLKIADFGTSRTGPELHEHAGTIGWEAPEQFFPAQQTRGSYLYQTDQRADFYALGLLLFFMISQGQKTWFSQQCQALHDEGQELAAWNSKGRVIGSLTDMDREIFLSGLGEYRCTEKGRRLLQLLEQLLAEHPENRPQDAREILVGIPF
ncbi:protein kinase family protein [Chitinilyticum aquatile]|uniref:protein kinase family protein n=1 Tax=Chitinilyticum aquatile TaxID=362520 RepID=UPI00041B700B|nr:protein kinase family protein [Chitinilyticum aquatile]